MPRRTSGKLNIKLGEEEIFAVRDTIRKDCAGKFIVSFIFSLYIFFFIYSSVNFFVVQCFI